MNDVVSTKMTYLVEEILNPIRSLCIDNKMLEYHSQSVSNPKPAMVRSNDDQYEFSADYQYVYDDINNNEEKDEYERLGKELDDDVTGDYCSIDDENYQTVDDTKTSQKTVSSTSSPNGNV